ncbi:biotin transporter BioY [Anaerofustis sp.]|uniref:biotin transporter BioY n=1 Tax=Anaerofustis sp. TaxID=1872517 RepID=UPI0025BC5BDB|nr:biotin transporter BioY [Anaerofustis sp.]
MKTKDLILCALSAVFMAICSWTSIPTSIPFTMQTFAVFFIIFVLGAKKAAISITVYILMGAIGIPVFSGFTSGMGILFGSTGGYIIGFLLSALFLSITKFIYKKSSIKTLIFSFISLFICYTAGTLWFYLVYTSSTGTITYSGILAMCVVPFIIPDTIKILLAFYVSKIIKSRIYDD